MGPLLSSLTTDLLDFGDTERNGDLQAEIRGLSASGGKTIVRYWSAYLHHDVVRLMGAAHGVVRHRETFAVLTQIPARRGHEFKMSDIRCDARGKCDIPGGTDSAVEARSANVLQAAGSRERKGQRRAFVEERTKADELVTEGTRMLHH